MSAPDGRTRANPTHGELVELLPWFVNGTLSGEQNDNVARHLAQCAACAEEAHWLRDVYESTNAATELYPISSRSLERVRSRIEAEAESPLAFQSPAPSRISDAHALLTRLARCVVDLCSGRAALIATPVTLVFAVAIYVQLQSPRSSMTADGFTTLSEQIAPRSGIELAVRPSSEAAQRAVAAALERTATGGRLRRAADGELRLALDPGTDLKAMTLLLESIKSSPAVDSARLAPEKR